MSATKLLQFMDFRFKTQEYAISKYGDKEWTSKNGKVTKLRDMNTRHIVNCIKKLQRGEINRNVGDWTRWFKEELKNRPKLKASDGKD